MKRNFALLFALLFTLLLAINFYFYSEITQSERKTILVARVIDGDTLVSSEETGYRLSNINAPEKNENGFEEAKEFLSSLEGKTIEIEELGEDKYGRILTRAYSQSYVNLELVRLGLAKKFLVDQHELKEFFNAEEYAIKNSLGIWKKSEYFGCFVVEINPEEETVQIDNTCEKINVQGWTLSDESRKKYIFEDVSLGEVILHTGNGETSEKEIFWNLNQNVWNNDRDTIYIYDEKDNLVITQSYGY